MPNPLRCHRVLRRYLKPLLVLATLLLIVSQSAFAIKPDRHYIASPRDAGLRYDSLTIRTQSGVRLAAWLCAPDTLRSNITIIMAGGDAGNMSYDIPLAAFLIKNFGLRVLLFDYRGFGASDTASSQADALVSPDYLHDLAAAVDVVRQALPKTNIVLYGRAMGGSLALVLAAHRSDLAGVIAESPFITQSVVADRTTTLNPTRHIPVIQPALLDPSATIKALKIQNLLLLHGAKERFVTTDDMQGLLKDAPAKNKELVVFPNADHLKEALSDTQLFGRSIFEFFQNSGLD